MKLTKKKFVNKLIAFLCAFLFVFLVMPVSPLLAAAKTGVDYIDYSYIQIGKKASSSIISPAKTVYAGDAYKIMLAYVGGNSSYAIGRTLSTASASGKTVNFDSSSVKVYYGGAELKEGSVKEYQSATDSALYPDYYGEFVAENVGRYTITYSYSYHFDSDTKNVYTNYYDFVVESTINSATLDLTGNNEHFLPKIIDLSLYGKTEGETTTYEDVTLPLPKILNQDGKEIEDAKLVVKTSSTQASEYATGDCLVITGNAGAASLVDGDTQYLKLSADGKSVVIDGEAFKTYHNYVEFAIKYAYYHEGEFVKSEILKTTVYDSYYNEYSKDNLVIETSSSLRKDVNIGEEQTLPGVTVTTNSKVTPNGAAVDVYYKVSVKYMSDKTSGWKDIKDVEVNGKKIYADVLDENGYLIDETKFTPLQRGTYTIIYTATDFYRNTITTSDGRYGWENLEDVKAPTPVLYDAAETTLVDDQQVPTYEDATTKLSSHVYANGVVLYAITAEDNVSERGKVDVKRIVLRDSEELFTIEGYDAYNLVFNYNNATSASSSTSAYQNFIYNNFEVRQKLAAQEEEITSDAAMLEWFLKNGYRVVIDKSNASTILGLFTDKFAGVADGDALITYLEGKTEAEIAALGFAYIPSSKTFGERDSSKGYGLATFTVQYWAGDEAGNSDYKSYSIEVSTGYDEVAPVITFSTTLENSYLTTDKVTFTKPGATDNEDSNSIMAKKVKTYFRFMTAEGAVTGAITDKEENTVENGFDSTDIVEYLIENRAPEVNDSNGVAYTTKYAAYKGAGYIDLTDDTLSSYTIDLSKYDLQTMQVTGVQILAYAYDGSGNIDILVKEFKISTAIDTGVPTFSSVEFADSSEDVTYYQHDKIELPTITIKDDLVTKVSYEIKVYPLKNGERQDALKGAAADAKQSWNAREYTYTLDAGSFIAPFEGQYLVSVAITDSSNNTIVVFLHYEAKPLFLVQDPTISVTIPEAQDGTALELDNKPVIKLPTPKVNYTIDNSIDYETYKSVTNWEGSQKPKYVVMGVNGEGYANDYSIENGQESSFVPERVGNYNFKYHVNLTVYDNTVVEYVGGTYEQSSEAFKFNYFQVAADETVRIKKESAEKYTIYIVENPSEEPTVSKTISVTVADKVATFNSESDFTTSFTKDAATKLFAESLISYDLESGNYTIKVQDKLGPTIAPYDYINSISAKDLEGDGYKLFIYGIRATDASDLNITESEVTAVLTYYEDGKTRTSTATLTGDEKLTGKEVTYKRNGTIVITYKVYDNAGNYSTYSKEIAVGDNEKPLISYQAGKSKADVSASSLTLDDVKNGLKFYVENFKFSDAEGIEKVEYTLTKDGEEDPIEAAVDSDVPGKDAKVLTYDISEKGEGTYTLTVRVYDNNGNYQDETVVVTVNPNEVNPDLVYQIIGTILIVISVLLLAGVIIYFVVSKVKLDKELKKSV